eukprot:GFUD01036101.1.p1 GENE.GFUD01036101.1~~GFUD01036101.1.p1  ORF type:complete len:562 (+),score=116.17 GFUD01036101.1:2-1687(+)
MNLPTIVPALLFIVSAHAQDKIEFECRSTNVSDVKVIKKDSKEFQPLEYLPPEKSLINKEIIGTFHQDLVVTGGECFHLVVEGHDGHGSRIEIVNLTRHTPLSFKPNFQTLDLCQDIVIWRGVVYNRRDPYQYAEGDVDIEGVSMVNSTWGVRRDKGCYHRIGTAEIVQDGWSSRLNKCRLDLGGSPHNPLKTWMQAQQSEDYPTVYLGSNKVTVHWGLAEKFNCTKFGKFETKINLKYEDIVTEEDRNETTFGKTVFRNLPNAGNTDLRCVPWEIELNLTIQMRKWTYNQRYLGFTISNSDEVFAFKKLLKALRVEEMTSSYDSKISTFSFKASNIECLEKTATVTFITPKHQEIRKINLDEDNKLNIETILQDISEKYCLEYQLIIDLSSLGTKVWSEAINTTMTVGLPRYEEEQFYFEVGEQFKNCRANLRLICFSEQNNIGARTFDTVGLTVERSKIAGMKCSAMAFVEDGDLEFKTYSECFYDDGSPCDASNMTLVFGLVSAGLLLVMVLLGFATCWVCHGRAPLHPQGEEMRPVSVVRRDRNYEDTGDVEYYSEL